MSQSAIAVENLSKKYLVGHRFDQLKLGHMTLRDVITREARNFTRKAIDVLRGRQVVQGDEVEEFWALKHVSFEVKQGEAVGIIGRNGAGKSTLLKILSRITEPTEGRVKLQGRVASLLEVGTGFHNELTGRENIFLNGAILGMKKSEIRRKFDEIVAFADVERFLDTPVKRYSSGMYVRLAFAVAAHLEPEILIVDEVLAVGDAEFQKKCLGKMDEISRREGRTVVFVSHNIESILRLCSRGILLNLGELVVTDDVKKVLAMYNETKEYNSKVVDLESCVRPRQFLGRARLDRVESGSDDGRWSFPFGQPLAFDVWVESRISVTNIKLGIGLFSDRGIEVASWSSAAADTTLALRPGTNRLRVKYEDFALLPGQYFLGISLQSERGAEDYIPEAVSLEVTVSPESAKISAHRFGGFLIPSVSVSSVQH
jgi:lipopolysaccharide transport system ATP-binding protein